MKLIRWVLLWAVVTVVAGFIAVIMTVIFGVAHPTEASFSDGIIRNVIWGLVVGTGQWLVLRRRLSRSSTWIPLTTFGSILPVLLGMTGWQSYLGAVLVGGLRGGCQSALLIYYFGNRGALWILTQGIAAFASMASIFIFQGAIPGLWLALFSVAVGGLIQAIGLIAVFSGGPPRR